ncbi:MAG: D-alanyl-D-alanine carboxypeptidase family protein [Actinomycetota bacterium]
MSGSVVDRSGGSPRGTARRVGHVAVAIALSLALAGLVLLPAVGRAQSVSPPPPTPVPIPGGGTSPSPFPSVLRTPPPAILTPPAIDAASAVLIDLDTGQNLFALDPAERRPVASLTKIMTAYLVLTRASPTDIVTVSENAASGQVPGISSLGLVTGERISVQELLYALLLQSANDAAVALAEHVGNTVEGFVALMNRTAARLGMARTTFASPNGLDDTGSSTAREMARLTRAAYALPGFGAIAATRTHSIPSPDGDPRVVQNRNALLWLYPGAVGVKTGFTSGAGFCIVAAADRGDERLLAVVLGEPGEAFSDAAALLNYGFAAFEHRLVIRDERVLAPVLIDGRRVPVAAGAALESLVPVGAAVRRSVELHPGVRFPPARGQAIGRVVLSVGELVLGEVPLVVTDVPPPPPLADDGSWWSRAFGAVVDAGSGLVDALLS